MAFNKDIRPDQLSKGQMAPRSLAERMNQGSVSTKNETRALDKTMFQGNMANRRPTPSDMETPNKSMKQGGR